jgi:hypothetical protein
MVAEPLDVQMNWQLQTRRGRANVALGVALILSPACSLMAPGDAELLGGKATHGGRGSGGFGIAGQVGSAGNVGAPDEGGMLGHAGNVSHAGNAGIAGAAVICPQGDTEKTCNNQQDDDCDGKADCADSDCNTKGCADGGRCCGSECATLKTNSHCGACDINCGSGSSCVENNNHAGFYACSCSSDQQCVSWGYGDGATCYAASGVTADMQCNCQCGTPTGTTCTAKCAGGAVCHMVDWENYCSY